MIKNLLGKLRNRLFARWIVCRLVPDKKSVQYGIYFSYPVYLLMVLSGILLQNPFVLLLTALIAFFAIKLPIHPFDYIYNFFIVKLIRTKAIPGRGSELQFNSIVAVVFSLVVFAFITFSIPINYAALAIIYTLANVFFISLFLLKD